MSSTVLPSLLDAKHHLPKLRYAEKAKVFGKNFQGGSIVCKGVQVGSPARLLYGVFGSTLPGFLFSYSPKSCSLGYGLKDFFPGTMSELSMTVVTEEF